MGVREADPEYLQGFKVLAGQAVFPKPTLCDGSAVTDYYRGSLAAMSDLCAAVSEKGLSGLGA